MDLSVCLVFVVWFRVLIHDWYLRKHYWLKHFILPFWCVFYVRQAIQTAAYDLVLHGIVSQSNRPSIINGVRFYDCCSNINCRLSRSKKASNINFTWILTDFMRMNEWNRHALFLSWNGRNRYLHSSLLKIWDFFHSWEKFNVFSLVPLRSTREKTEFLTLMEEIPNLQ
jgi:hypothetical protein